MKAFEQIRAFAAGRKVSAPGRYYEDEGDYMDCARAVGWVLEALFTPDYRGDNQVGSDIYVPDQEAVLKAPQSYSFKNEDRASDPMTTFDPTSVIKTCLYVLGRSKPIPHDDREHNFKNMNRKIDVQHGERIVSLIEQTLSTWGGPIDGDGEWTDIPAEKVEEAQKIVNELLFGIVPGAARVALYDKCGEVRNIIYPTVYQGPSNRYGALQALSEIEGALGRVVRAYQHEDSEAYREIEAQKKAKIEAAREVELTKEILDQHAQDLEGDHDPAAALLLGRLRDGDKLPTYKGISKRPTPKRDAMIDQLHAFLGDGAHETLRNLGSQHAQYRIDGLSKLSEVLKTKFDDHSPEM